MNQRVVQVHPPFRVEVDSDGVAMNVCQVDAIYHAKIKLGMNSVIDGRVVAQSVSILPYMIVRSHADAPDDWTAVTQDDARTDSNSLVKFQISRPGKYRLYIKEPTLRFEPHSTFSIPFHDLADGTNSGREVQPLLELDVTQDSNCVLSIRRVHPNTLERARGPDAGQIPADGIRQQFNETHTSSEPRNALDLGTYTISHQLWADASRAYGLEHPLIEASRFRNLLRIIYGEALVHATGTGEQAHDRILRSDGLEIQFNNQSTTGGRRRQSFRENNGQPGNRMTSDEVLRRTHPTTMEFLLQMMTDLDISIARSTGAWRPHYGSTRHRYATALDLTHLRTTTEDAANQRHVVNIHLNRRLSLDSQPLATRQGESAQQSRMREFSNQVHRYIANARQEGTLSWLGGPWARTYAQLDLLGPLADGQRSPDDLAIKTDTHTHFHHLHISVGVDQP